MRPTVSQYAAALEALSFEGTIGVKDISRNFLGFLKRRGESDKASLIVKQLEKRALEQSGKLMVAVVTAHELSEEMKKSLMKKAEEMFPGKSVMLSYEIDSTVIGGARFRTDETLYDATVLAELGALKKVLH